MPVKLPCRYKSCKFGNDKMFDGILPVKPAESISKYSRFVKAYPDIRILLAISGVTTAMQGYA